MMVHTYRGGGKCFEVRPGESHAAAWTAALNAAMEAGRNGNNA